MKNSLKILALLFAAFFVLAGCAERPAASYADGSPQSSEAEPSSQAAATKAPVSAAEESPESKEVDPNALHICFDLGSNVVQSDREMRVFETLLANGIRLAGGTENIVFDSIPYSGSEREIALDKIRTDIMAGGGPDVFIVATRGSNSIFPVPEKAMHEGLFLPLDSYIQSAAQSDWDKLTPAVMEAGQTDEGQVLVPMLYTTPITIYRKEDVPEAPPAGTTWQEMLEDETNILRNAVRVNSEVSGGLVPSPRHNALAMLGAFADYETGELLFFEEDLLQWMETQIALQEESNSNAVLPAYIQGKLCGATTLIYENSGQSDWPIHKEDRMTMIPLYSKDGGVTATVEAYTGVNRNTKHAEEAFFVVDYLMRAETQQEFKMYVSMSMTVGLPIHESVLSAEYPQQKGYGFFTDENFEELCGVRDQITDVHFNNTLLESLEKMYYTLMLDHTDEERSEQVVKDAVHKAYVEIRQMLSE